MLIEHLEPDLFLLIGDTYNSNSTLLINGEDVLMVDSMASKEDAEELRKFIEIELRKQVRFIVCTHYFSDHLAALKLFPKAQIIAHKNYLHTFTAEKFRSPEEEANFVEPNVLISDGIKIKWGRYTLDIFYNPGHTMSTINIDIPEADLLMVGDTIVNNIVYIYYTVPEMFFPALELLKRRGRSRLISSHMGVRSSSAIDNALFYLVHLQEEVKNARRLRDSDASIMEIALEMCINPEVTGSNFEKVFHKRNLESIIERKLFSTINYSI